MDSMSETNDWIPEGPHRAWVVKQQWLVPPPGEKKRRPHVAIAMTRTRSEARAVAAACELVMCGASYRVQRLTHRQAAQAGLRHCFEQLTGAQSPHRCAHGAAEP